MIMQYRILPDDIYNFDETGFAMGLISTAKVVTRATLVINGATVRRGFFSGEGILIYR